MTPEYLTGLILPLFELLRNEIFLNSANEEKILRNNSCVLSLEKFKREISKYDYNYNEGYPISLW